MPSHASSRRCCEPSWCMANPACQLRRTCVRGPLPRARARAGVQGHACTQLRSRSCTMVRMLNVCCVRRGACPGSATAGVRAREPRLAGEHRCLADPSYRCVASIVYKPYLQASVPVHRYFAHSVTVSRVPRAGWPVWDRASPCPAAACARCERERPSAVQVTRARARPLSAAPAACTAAAAGAARGRPRTQQEPQEQTRQRPFSAPAVAAAAAAAGALDGLPPLAMLLVSWARAPPFGSLCPRAPTQATRVRAPPCRSHSPRMDTDASGRARAPRAPTQAVAVAVAADASAHVAAGHR